MTKITGKLPDHEIRRLSCDALPPMIAGYEKRLLQAYGYDVRLAPGPFRRVSKSWGKPIDPLAMHPDEREFERLEFKLGDKVRVEFGDLWLALSVEWFNLPDDVTMDMQNKSKYCRAGVTPNAGLAPAEAGWRGFFEFELTCLQRNGAVYTVGEPIGQASFWRGAACERPYSSDGHVYQDQDEIKGPAAK